PRMAVPLHPLADRADGEALGLQGFVVGLAPVKRCRDRSAGARPDRVGGDRVLGVGVAGTTNSQVRTVLAGQEPYSGMASLPTFNRAVRVQDPGGPRSLRRF